MPKKRPFPNKKKPGPRLERRGLAQAQQGASWQKKPLTSGGNPRPPRSSKQSASSANPPAKSALLTSLPNISEAHFTANSQALLLARFPKNTLTLYDLATQSETPPLKILPNTNATALSTDNRFIAMATSKQPKNPAKPPTPGHIAVQSSHTGKLLWKSPLNPDATGDTATNAAGGGGGGDPARQLLFTHDSSLLLATSNHWLRAYNTLTGEPSNAFPPVPGASVQHLALSRDGLFLAHSETRSNSVLIWHLPSKQVAHFIRLPTSKGKIAGLAFGPTVRQLHIAQSLQLSTYNAETGTPTHNFPLEGATDLALIHNAEVLAILRHPANDSPPSLEIWSAHTGNLRRSIKLPEGAFGPLSASPDGTLLALPSGKSLYIWKSEKLSAI